MNFYLQIGGVAALFNLVLFLTMFNAGVDASISAPVAFVAAAIVNYVLCVLILFKHQVKWKAPIEWLAYTAIVGSVLLVDLMVTKYLLEIDLSPLILKLTATGIALILNFSADASLYFLKNQAIHGSPKVHRFSGLNKPNETIWISKF